ncbi:MAG: CoA ester lyase [Candidatus Dormiibacterota bacterium]
MILRSTLFAPANHRRHAEKAVANAADAAILDLEDAVSIAEKPAAREAARELLARSRPPGTVVFVRINGLEGPFAYDDLRAVVGPGLDGIVVPKIESGSQLAIVDWLLRQLERERGLRASSIDLLPIVETARGLTAVDEIAAASARVRRLNFGAGDFTLDTGMTWTPGNPALLWAKVRVIVASRSAGLERPLDTVYPDLRDAAGFEREAVEAKQLGFQGKACIHPSQVEIVHRIFTPSAEEVARAREVTSAFERAVAGGSASIQLDGQFIDYPIAERARRVIQIAEGLRSGG